MAGTCNDDVSVLFQEGSGNTDGIVGCCFAGMIKGIECWNFKGNVFNVVSGRIVYFDHGY